MSTYQALTDNEIAIGGPVQNPTLVKIQGDLDYLNTQVAALLTGNQNPEPLLFQILGAPDIRTLPETGVLYMRVWANITLTAGKIWVPKAGSGGTLQIDVQYKRGVSAYASIFGTPPSTASTDGDGFITTNGVLSVTSLLAGDFLRLDITSAQTGCKEFDVLLPYTFT